MNPITHRNREIERLERELAESREECRRLREALQPTATIWNNWLYDRQTKNSKADVMFSQWLINEHDLGQIGAPFFKASEALEAAQAVAPKVEDK